MPIRLAEITFHRESSEDGSGEILAKLNKFIHGQRGDVIAAQHIRDLYQSAHAVMHGPVYGSVFLLTYKDSK